MSYFRLFFLFHRLTTAVNGAVSSLGNNEFGATLGAAVSFTYLVCHIESPFRVYSGKSDVNNYFPKLNYYNLEFKNLSRQTEHGTVRFWLSEYIAYCRFADIKLSNNTTASFIKDMLKYIIDKVNGTFLISLAVFIISFAMVAGLYSEQLSQSFLVLIVSRVFDVIGMVSLFVCWLTLGVGES